MMGGYGRGFGGFNNMMGGGWYGGILVFVFGALVLIGIVLLVIWAVRALSDHGTGRGAAPPSGVAGHDEAVAIAKRRLASGEIDKAQYEEIVRTLGG